MRPRLRPIFALTLVGLTAFGGVAHADDYCVSPQATCAPADTFSQVQPALDAASNHIGDDRVLIGGGTFTAPSGGFQYNGAQPGTVDIRGASREATTLAQTPSGVTETALRIVHAGPGRSAVSGLTVTVASGPSNFGLWLISDTDARDVAVRAQDGVTNARGVDLRGTSTLQRSLVEAPGGAPAVQGGGGLADDTRVEDSTLVAAKGVEILGGGLVTIVRSRVVATDSGLLATNSRLRADNVVVDMNNAGMGSRALDSFGASGTDAHIDARNITVLGDAPSVNGASAFAINSMATISLINSIVRVQGRPLIRNAGANPGDKPAVVNASNNNYRADGAAVFSSGNGTLTDDNRRTDDPRFLGDPQLGALRLRFDSPLIDAGIGGGDQPTDDFNGDPRVVDGDGNGSAVRDLGAFEYQRRPPVGDRGRRARERSGRCPVRLERDRIGPRRRPDRIHLVVGRRRDRRRSYRLPRVRHVWPPHRHGDRHRRQRRRGQRERRRGRRRAARGARATSTAARGHGRAAVRDRPARSAAQPHAPDSGTGRLRRFGARAVRRVADARQHEACRSASQNASARPREVQGRAPAAPV